MFSGGGEDGGREGREGPIFIRKLVLEAFSSGQYQVSSIWGNGETRKGRNSGNDLAASESGLVSFDFRLSSSPMAERTAKERQRERSNLHFSSPPFLFLSFFLSSFLSSFFFPPLPLPRVQTDHEPISQYNGFQFEMVTKWNLCSNSVRLLEKGREGKERKKSARNEKKRGEFGPAFVSSETSVGKENGRHSRLGRNFWNCQ